MNLTVDFGNTAVKIGVFEGRKLIHAESFIHFSKKHLNGLLKKYALEGAATASVVNNSTEIERSLKFAIPTIRLTASTKLPFNIFYKTPKTLGADRIANLIGAQVFFRGKNLLVISAGTCITYDALAGTNYFGGSITPGIDLRLKAMNTFTDRLPFVQKKDTVEFFGKTTETSMLTGAILGAFYEMKGFIHEYKTQYSSLKVILTGGDAPLFASRFENKIFAVPHLVLYGLNEILLRNNAS